MIRCLNCGAETSNGLALCQLCQRSAETIFEFAPVYFRNLARWRPGRTGSRPVPGSRVLYEGPLDYDGTGDRISDRLDEAVTMLTTRARMFADDRPNLTRPLTWSDAVLSGDLPDAVVDELADDPARAVAALCAGFNRHLTSISTLDWCGDFLRDLIEHEGVLRELTEALIPGWYAGACKRCNLSTYVVPGLTWVTCQGCGTTTYARDHLDTIIDEAADWISTPRQIAEAIVALIDTEQSVPRLYERIHKWGAREKITPIRRYQRAHVFDYATESIVVGLEEVGFARYRFGEVLDRLLSEGATRTGKRATA